MPHGCQAAPDTIVDRHIKTEEVATRRHKQQEWKHLWSRAFAISLHFRQRCSSCHCKPCRCHPMKRSLKSTRSLHIACPFMTKHVLSETPILHIPAPPFATAQLIAIASLFSLSLSLYLAWRLSLQSPPTRLTWWMLVGGRLWDVSCTLNDIYSLDPARPAIGRSDRLGPSIAQLARTAALVGTWPWMPSPSYELKATYWLNLLLFCSTEARKEQMRNHQRRGRLIVDTHRLLTSHRDPRFPCATGQACERGFNMLPTPWWAMPICTLPFFHSVFSPSF